MKQCCGRRRDDVYNSITSLGDYRVGEWKGDRKTPKERSLDTSILGQERKGVLCVDWRLAVGTEMGRWKSTHAMTSNS